MNTQGECNECKVKRATKCVCGKEVKEMSCGAADWNCEQVKNLMVGNNK